MRTFERGYLEEEEESEFFLLHLHVPRERPPLSSLRVLSYSVTQCLEPLGRVVSFAVWIDLDAYGWGGASPLRNGDTEIREDDERFSQIQDLRERSVVGGR